MARNKPLVEGMGKEINKQSVFINLSRLSDSTKPFAFKVFFFVQFLFCFVFLHVCEKGFATRSEFTR